MGDNVCQALLSLAKHKNVISKTTSADFANTVSGFAQQTGNTGLEAILVQQMQARQGFIASHEVGVVDTFSGRGHDMLTIHEQIDKIADESCQQAKASTVKCALEEASRDAKDYVNGSISRPDFKTNCAERTMLLTSSADRSR